MGTRGLLVVLVLVAAVVSVTAVPALGAPVTQSQPRGAKSTVDARQGGQPGGASSRLVPVWPLVDGDMPVSFGRVSVVATTEDPAHVGDRRPVVQRTGAGSERTNAAGVAMLDFGRLPRRFTVVVRGGFAHGRRFPGTLYAEVRNHGTDVVEVNPVTTLTAYVRTVGRGMGGVRARRRVKRLLAIPAWHDTTRDLRRADEHFDGDAYLAAVRRRGSVAALNRALLAELRDGDGDRWMFRESGARMALAPLDWLKLVEDPEALVATGFEELANFVFGKIGDHVTNGALGWLTSIAPELGFGGGDEQRAELAEIRAALEAMGKQLTRLEGQVQGVYRAVQQAELSELAHQTDVTIGQIDHAESQLAVLANMSPDDPTVGRFAETINDYIGSRLLDAPAILNRYLSPGIRVADNVIKAAYQAVAAGTPRVFDSGKSAQAKSIYDYFAGYQMQLAVLLTNYWHSKPDTYSGSTISENLFEIQRNVTVEQRASLKPSVPGGAWVDPRTGLMWTFTDTPVDGVALLESYLKNTNLAPLGEQAFANWRLPTRLELADFTSGIGGSARAYLNAQLGFDDAVVRNTWTSDSLTRARWSLITGDEELLRVGFFNLNSNTFVPYSDPGHQFNQNAPPYSWPLEVTPQGCGVNSPTLREWLRAKVARGLFYVRQPAAGEDYWWGAARASQKASAKRAPTQKPAPLAQASQQLSPECQRGLRPPQVGPPPG
jgi:hypothetical protein